ncbi:chorismate mutase [Lipomyces doorenjongii]|uniref:chorismate mutase n=1 Tax=Lipomyces doorenjongii TaxID=383834 RepID=UPI0034CDE3FC
MDFLRPDTVMDLKNIRAVLVRMEDTIVFNLIERAKFPRQPSSYQKGGIAIPEFDGSFVDWILREEEIVHAKVRRYQSPDEVPFFPDDLPEPILPPISYPPVLYPHPNKVNVNDRIKDFYVSEIVPSICPEGEQKENLGSSSLCDVECLRSLSRRIHFGRFVAESKFLMERETMTAMIKAKDMAGLDAAITNSAVEKQVLARLKKKAETYGIDPNLMSSPNHKKVDAGAVVAMYENWVIPLTKEVEVEYLLHRLDQEG